MNRTMNDQSKADDMMISTEALALLGGGKIAHVKSIRSDVPTLFPAGAPDRARPQAVRADAADGTPIMLTDSREAAVANA
jgi:hypothetical protein